MSHKEDKYEDYEYNPTNRERRLRPRKARIWCDWCDSFVVGNWEKCPICGKRSGNKTLKK